MIWRRGIVSVLLTCGAIAAPTYGQTPANPDFLEQYAATYHFRLGRPGAIRPTPDGESILFLRSGPRSFERTLYELDVATGNERPLLTADDLLDGAEQTFTDEEEARRQRRREAGRGITSYQLSEDGRRLLIPLAGRLFVLDRPDGRIRELAIDGGRPEVPRLSPNGARVGYVIDDDLYVVEIESGRQHRLTTDAGGTVSNGLAEFVAQEEMGRHQGFWWSPDSTQIACQQTDTAGVELMSVMDALQPDRPARSWPYPRPGKTNATVRLMILDTDGGPARWVEWDRDAYPYLATVKWKTNAPLTILVQNRRQTEEVLLAVDPTAGTSQQLLVERDEAWIDLDQKMPHWLEDGNAFLWTTERDGAWQLELRSRDGSLRRVLTPGSSGFRRFVHLDEQRNRVWVLAGVDPTQTHLEHHPLEPGSDSTHRISRRPGNHGAVFSRDGSVFVHTWGGMRGESFEIRAEDGPVLGELTSVAETPSVGYDLNASVRFVTVGDDPELHAVLVHPRDFQSDRTYPVIVHVYGGPTGVMVSKSSRRYLLDQWIADQGYVVIAIDGRGTPHRGRDWQRAVKHDLIDVPLHDQVQALQRLGERFDYLDMTRVGIYGWSFGGYFSAMAVMRHPDVFRAAVAGAPVVDWLDYDTHYTERYMGLPQDNPSGYHASNVLTWAAELERPLLIVHGTADDNVYFTHSLKLATALTAAGKPHELLPLTGSTHMVPDPEVVRNLYGRIMGFFDANLAAGQAVLAADPPVTGSQTRVPVPEPDEKAMRYYNSGCVLWWVNLGWGLLIPALFLITGFSARIRNWARAIGRRWFFVIGAYFVIFLAINWVLDFPLSYYQGFIRQHDYGLSNQSFGKWFGDSLKALLVGMIMGVAILWGPYLALKKSPKRWWLYTGLGTVPVIFFLMLVTPIWVDPLFNDFGPMNDQALEAKILALADQSGIEGGRVYEVNKSVDTEAVNAYVTGFLDTKRIVLWDTTIRKLSESELLFVMAHEMGHYVLGHVIKGVLFFSLVILAVLYVIHRVAGVLIGHCKGRIGFDELSDIASLPLIILLVNVLSLVVTPVTNTFTRHIEHESDRFALEITQDNHGGASAFVVLQAENLGNPRPGLLYKLWRSSHPTLADRIDFCNDYRPWETGDPLKYAHLFAQ